MNEIAPDFPDTNFAVIDGFATCGTACGLKNDDLKNVADLTFKEQEGSYLVGVAAALKCGCDTIGFLGGQQGIGLIEKFEAGYTAGALSVNPKMNVLVEYIGTDETAFNDAVKGEALSTKMYDDGAEIIYHAAGASGAGLFNAAVKAQKLRDRRRLGPVPDRESRAAALILTSMLKRVDVATYNAIKQTGEGSFVDRAAGLRPGRGRTRLLDVQHRGAHPGHHGPDGRRQAGHHRRQDRRPRRPDQDLAEREPADDERRGAGRESAPPLVVLDHITKRFPGVTANDDVTSSSAPVRCMR